MAKTTTIFVAALTAFALVGCGGGGGDAGTPAFGSGTGPGSGTGTGTETPVAGSAAISLSMSSATVTSAQPSTVTVIVTDASTGAALPSKVVQFSTAASLGTFSAASALTGADGRAVVSLTPAVGSTSGADEVIASTSHNGASVSQRLGFQLTASNVTVASFTNGVASGTRLAAYGQSNLTLTLGGVASGTPVEVNFSSACVAKGKASINPARFTTTTGAVSAVYRDNGCGATDATDTVQAVLTGSNASSTTAISLTSPTVNSITFAEATPATIYLRGSGLGESSTVSFRVVDTANNPLPNQQVQLALSTAAGGVTMDQSASAVTKASDGDGLVTVQINSGTVPTPVRVSATLVGTQVSTVSSVLTVAVGLPSQLNFSLAQGTHNIEGFNRDGTTNTYSIIASDRSGNPVPIGTAINFVTEGGQVEASKQIASVSGLSRATANFVSAGQRPADGRITVTAYALGEESFLDINGNNVWDAGESFQDLGDVYKDRLFDNSYDSAADEFISLGITAAQACASNGSNPLLSVNADIPSRPATCDGTWGRAYVRRAVETVLSTSSARPLWPWVTPRTGVPQSGCSIVNLQTDSTAVRTKFYQVAGTTIYGLSSSGSMLFVVADANGTRVNPVAAGSTVAVSATTGLGVLLLGGGTVPSTSEASSAVFSYTFTAGVTSGLVSIVVTSPSGLATTSFIELSTVAMPGTETPCTR